MAVATLIAVGGAMAIGGSLLGYSSRKKSARARAKAAKMQYGLRLQQSDEIIDRFKYNRIRERLNAQRFTGKQITAFANAGVSGRTPLTVIEDTIGLVEESLLNKQMDIEFEARTIRKQAEIDLILGKAAAKAEGKAATAGLLRGLGSTAASFGTFNAGG